MLWRVWFSVVLLALPLAIPLALSEGSELHSGWYGLGESFEVAGLTVKLGTIPWRERVLVDINGTTTGLYTDDCSTVKDIIFCLDDVEERNGSLSYHIIVNAPSGKISVGKSASVSEVFPGEEVEFKLTLENTGNRKLSLVSYRDEFPEQFSVLKVIDCDVDGGVVSWSGELNAGQKHECIYRVQGVQPTTFKSVGVVKYDSGVAQEAAETNAVTLTVKGYEVELSATADEADIDEPSIIVIKTKNNVDAALDVRVSVSLPQGVVIDAGELQWSESFEKKGTKQRNFTVRASKSGEHVLEARALYSYKQFSRDIRVPVKLAIARPKVRLEQSAKYKANPGETGMVEWSLANDGEVSVKDVKAFVNSSLASGSLELPGLDAGEKKVVFSRQYTAPSVPGTYQVPISVYFRNEHGEKFTLSDTITITVIGQPTVTFNVSETAEEPVEEDREKEVVEEEVPEIPISKIPESPSLLSRLFSWLKGLFGKGS